jgi:hypothetical protein
MKMLQQSDSYPTLARIKPGKIYSLSSQSDSDFGVLIDTRMAKVGDQYEFYCVNNQEATFFAHIDGRQGTTLEMNVFFTRTNGDNIFDHITEVVGQSGREGVDTIDPVIAAHGVVTVTEIKPFTNTIHMDISITVY